MMPSGARCVVPNCNRIGRGPKWDRMCWAHFKARAPDRAAPLVRAQREQAAHCKVCGPVVVAQRTDPASGDRLCRPCHFFITTRCCCCCTAAACPTASAICRQCGEAVPMCLQPHGLRRGLLCGLCRARHGQRCGLCDLALPLRQSSLWFCDSCGSSLNTNMCHLCGNATATLRSCSLCPPGCVPNACHMCDACASWTKVSCCLACYHLTSDLKDRCIACKASPPRRRQPLFAYCQDCSAENPYEAVNWLRNEATVELHLASAASFSALLVSQGPSTSPDLPAYSPVADFLDPNHCRLCLAPVPPENFDSHLRSCHHIDRSVYRSRVLRSVLRTGPEVVSPQLLRTRLAGFARACNKHLDLAPCASCARLKPTAKLLSCVIPPSTEPSGPEWLAWPATTWTQAAEQWLQGMDKLLSVDSYWTTVCQGPARIAAAQSALRGQGPDSLEVVWLRRVEAWARNTQQALHADAVGSPVGTLWLLLPEAVCPLDATSSALVCKLCCKCRSHFAAMDARGLPQPTMPPNCRANGLWGGPEPEPLRNLSWLGKRIIRLARPVLSLRTLAVPEASGASSDPRTSPLYTTGNCLIFPSVVTRLHNPWGCCRRISLATFRFAVHRARGTH